MKKLTALALAAASLTLGTAAQAHTPHPLTPAVADGLAPGARRRPAFNPIHLANPPPDRKSVV